MKRTLIGTLAAAFVSTTLIAAQDPQPQDQQRSSPPAAAQQEKTVTYSGCLEAGPTAGTYVLSNATEVISIPSMRSPGMTPPATPPTGTPPAGTPPTGVNPPTPANPPTTAADVKGQSFTLQGTPVGFDLATNLNHKVQVTGIIAETSTARVDPMPERGAAVTKSFTIRSAKSLADRCTAF